MKKISLFTLSLVCLIVPFSCKQKDVEPNYRMSSVLYKLDISNAEFLVFMNYYSGYNPSALYKVTTDGALEEVSHLSINGKKLLPNFYSYSFGMTDHYILTNSSYNEICLVRKSDGVLFRIGSETPTLPTFLTYANGKIKTSTDAQGNIYFMGSNGMGGSSVYKISTSPSAFMKLSQYSSSGENIFDFEVDSRGNMVYSSYVDYYGYAYRLLKADGSITDITPFIGMTLGKDDNFYVSQSNGYSTIDILKLTIDNDLAVSTAFLGTYQSDYTAFDTDYKAYNGNKTIFAYESKITQLNPDNGTVTNYTSPASSFISDISYSSTDLYLLANDYNYSNNTVYKIPNSTYASYSYPVPPADYYVDGMAASNNGNLLASATRNSDFTKVLLRVDNGGNMTTLAENVDLYNVAIWKLDQ